jgi:hypothetical protein
MHALVSMRNPADVMLLSFPCMYYDTMHLLLLVVVP